MQHLLTALLTFVVCAAAVADDGLHARNGAGELVLNGKRFNFVVIYQTGIGIEPILHGVIHPAGKVWLGAMGQVTPRIQAHTQHRITRL